MFWCTEQDFLILERNTYQIRMQEMYHKMNWY